MNDALTAALQTIAAANPRSFSFVNATAHRLRLEGNPVEAADWFAVAADIAEEKGMLNSAEMARSHEAELRPAVSYILESRARMPVSP